MFQFNPPNCCIAARRAYVPLLFLIWFLAILFRPFISKSAAPIFAKFAGLVEVIRL